MTPVQLISIWADTDVEKRFWAFQLLSYSAFSTKPITKKEKN